MIALRLVLEILEKVSGSRDRGAMPTPVSFRHTRISAAVQQSAI